MINIKKNENYNKSCDYRLASVYRGAFCYPVPRTVLLESLGQKLNIINFFKFHPKCVWNLLKYD